MSTERLRHVLTDIEGKDLGHAGVPGAGRTGPRGGVYITKQTG
jgi:hypothetical protein